MLPDTLNSFEGEKDVVINALSGTERDAYTF